MPWPPAAIWAVTRTGAHITNIIEVRKPPKTECAMVVELESGETSTVMAAQRFTSAGGSTSFEYRTRTRGKWGGVDGRNGG